eukprot:c35961_g1_i1 orf=93-401(+)
MQHAYPIIHLPGTAILLPTQPFWRPAFIWIEGTKPATSLLHHYLLQHETSLFDPGNTIHCHARATCATRLAANFSNQENLRVHRHRSVHILCCQTSLRMQRQ